MRQAKALDDVATRTKAVALLQRQKDDRLHSPEFGRRETELKKALAESTRSFVESEAALTAQAAELSERAAVLEHRNRSLSVEVAALAAGTIDSETVAALFDWSAISDPDDRDQIAEAVTQLLWQKPYLRGHSRQGDIEAGARGRPHDVDEQLTPQERIKRHHAENMP